MIPFRWIDEMPKAKWYVDAVELSADCCETTQQVGFILKKKNDVADSDE